MKNIKNRPLLVASHQNQRSMVSRCTERFKLLGYKSSKQPSKDFSSEYLIMQPRPSAHNMYSDDPVMDDTRQQRVQEIEEMVETIKQRNKFKQKYEYE